MKKELSIALASILIPLSSFGLTLQEAVHHVTSTNPIILESIENYRATTYDADMAKAGYLPSIDLVGRYGTEKTTTAATPSDGRSLKRYDREIKVTENIFNGFGTVEDVKKQEARIEAAKMSVMEKANQLSLQATEAYLGLMKQYETLKLAEENLKKHEEIHQKIKERTDSGFGTKSEIDQSSARVALANSNVIIQRSNYRDAMTKFKRIYGEDVAPETMVKPVFSSALASNFDTALDEANANYPSLLVQNNNIIAAEHNVKVAMKEYYPRVDVELRRTRNDNVSGVEGPDDTESAMIIASYNLYAGGYYQANRDKQQVNVLKEKQSINDIKLRVRENLDYAWTAYDELKKQMPYLKEHRDYTTSTLESYAKEFELGRRTLIDMLNTENERFSAEKEVVNNEYDLLFAQYRILEATGALAKELDANPSL
ncbi:TolC family outer membrane protein [Sulfuricurvum sp.]|uniref:TolC family outer membrane protein n=1 Tax=Sulfuricurvum sp. TaxID=2025608 RepID=UPI003BAF12F9